MDDKKTKRKKYMKIGACLGLAGIVFAAGMHYKSRHDPYSGKIKYAISQMHDRDDFVRLDYNGGDGGAFSICGPEDNPYFSTAYNIKMDKHVFLVDRPNNGYGQIDEIKGYDRDEDAYYFSDKPSKKLEKLSKIFFHNGIDATIKAIDEDDTKFSGPEFMTLLDKLKEEGKKIPR